MRVGGMGDGMGRERPRGEEEREGVGKRRRF